MVHTDKCFFQEGNTWTDLNDDLKPPQSPLSVWYIDKLAKIDKSEYEEHLHCRDSRGSNLVHAAVFAQDVVALQFLIGLKGVDLDAKDQLGLTPLLLCMHQCYKPDVARCLIAAGCDIHYCIAGTTPLMLTGNNYHHPDVAHMLIKRGADLNAKNIDDYTALHFAINLKQYETACMLLYYGAEANETNGHNATPFLLALIRGDPDMPDLVLNYVTDVNRRKSGCNTLLMDALAHRSQCYSRLLDAGADVNACLDNRNALALSLNMPNSDAFRRIWKKFRYKKVYRRNSKSIFFSLRKCSLPNGDWLKCLRVLLDSKQFGDVAYHFYKFSPMHKTLIKWLVFGCRKRRIPERTCYEYVCLLLTRGEPVFFTDIEAVYLKYGYGETLKLLLQMNVVPNFCYQCVLPYFMCNLYRCENEIILEALIFQAVNADDPRLKVFPEFWLYFGRPGTVPKLTQLARHASRRAIGLMCKRKSICQFYTVLKRLGLPTVIEKIITYVHPIYF